MFRCDEAARSAGDRHIALKRRMFLTGLSAVHTTARSLAAPGHVADGWRTFKSRFLAQDGRIVDNGNGDVSHSEGQGWGLLFSVAAEDQASFDLILRWTKRALRRPNDALHAWRYVPAGGPSVPDPNNAVDGDMFIATALIRAGRLWRRPDHISAGAAIGRDILRLLVRQVGPFTVLLPGVSGFETAEAVTVNPSYYAFPMMAEIGGIVPSQKWRRLQSDGQSLIDRGRFGHWALPPDWLRIGKVDGALSLAPAWQPRFSFDAIRVPLWWTWQGLPLGPGIQSIDSFWSESSSQTVPAWVDLDTGAVAPYAATAGTQAIMRLVRLAFGGAQKTTAYEVADAKNYYDAALILLAGIAEQEMSTRQEKR
jgi:endoglucanase